MRKFKVTVNGSSYTVEVAEEGVVAVAPVAPAPAVAAPAPAAPVAAAPAPVAAPVAAAAPAAVPDGANIVKSPMPGKIVGVKVALGDTVKKGQVLVILEAMKMQNEIISPWPGKIVDLRVKAGQSVSSGEPIIFIA